MTTLATTLFLFISLLCSGLAEECPKPSPNFRSGGGSGISTNFRVENRAGVPLVAHWVDGRGVENGRTYEVLENEILQIQSFTGHSFRIYANTEKRPMLKEYQLRKKGKDAIAVYACDDVEVEPFDGNKYHKEMKRLVHDQTAACLPEDKSSEWSCIRWIHQDEYESRAGDSSKYGFNSTHEAGERQVGETMDLGYTRHIPQIPRLTNGKGFLKMSFTNSLRNTLMPWYEENRKGGPKDSVAVHPPIPGGYTNSHAVTMSKLDLDKHDHIQRAVCKEMQRVLEWWTGQKLVHTSTFGLRIYHRGSMLINHVDRADTHLASAVIQVSQDVDEGWPLEVFDRETGNFAEVYLQPGEMVLYEGARFAHGRPMRFNGSDFANIFTHFRPLDWNGPGRSPKYDGKLDEQGYLPSSEIYGGEDRLAGKERHTEL